MTTTCELCGQRMHDGPCYGDIKADWRWDDFINHRWAENIQKNHPSFEEMISTPVKYFREVKHDVSHPEGGK